jgi:predicted ArsR family transcriptional regulator
MAHRNPAPRNGATRREAPPAPAFAWAPERIRFEDEWLIIVDKPAGLPTQPTLDARRASAQSTLAAFLRERGYEAEVVEEEGALYLCQRRCPKLALSKEHEALCESELLAYEEALGLPLAREERIAEGGRCCRYRVKPVS